MRSRNGLFSETYPVIYSHPWSFYMRIRYMRAYFLSPYLLHITRSTCISFHSSKHKKIIVKNLIYHKGYYLNGPSKTKVENFSRFCFSSAYQGQRGLRLSRISPSKLCFFPLTSLIKSIKLERNNKKKIHSFFSDFSIP